MGFEEATPIQAETIPVGLSGVDLIGQAQTGTGKTAAFGIPTIERLDAKSRNIQALILAPTRELAIQVAEELNRIGEVKRVHALPVYGGQQIDRQIRALRKNPQIVVATPGRLMDHMNRKTLNLDHVQTVILDEADEMLDQGFLDDVKALMAQTAPHRQTMLFSATMPGPIVALTRSFMRRPVRVRADNSSGQATHATTEQIVFQTHRLENVRVFARILQTPGRGRTIVFTRTKRQAALVAEDLAGSGFRVGAVHGDMRQKDREESLNAFREGSVDVMVATDVAARGIDVDDVTHVINYQVPEDDKTYVHRIGRTGRAGHSGVAVTLVDWDDLTRWQAIDDTLGLGHPNPPRWFSTSPEFLTEFSLPADVADRVGRSLRVHGSASSTAPAHRNHHRGDHETGRSRH